MPSHWIGGAYRHRTPHPWVYYYYCYSYYYYYYYYYYNLSVDPKQVLLTVQQLLL